MASDPHGTSHAAVAAQGDDAPQCLVCNDAPAVVTTYTLSVTETLCATIGRVFADAIAERERVVARGPDAPDKDDRAPAGTLVEGCGCTRTCLACFERLFTFTELRGVCVYCRAKFVRADVTVDGGRAPIDIDHLLAREHASTMADRDFAEFADAGGADAGRADVFSDVERGIVRRMRQITATLHARRIVGAPDRLYALSVYMQYGPRGRDGQGIHVQQIGSYCPAVPTSGDGRFRSSYLEYGSTVLMGMAHIDSDVRKHFVWNTLRADRNTALDVCADYEDHPDRRDDIKHPMILAFLALAQDSWQLLRLGMRVIAEGLAGFVAAESMAMIDAFDRLFFLIETLAILKRPFERIVHHLTDGTELPAVLVSARDLVNAHDDACAAMATLVSHVVDHDAVEPAGRDAARAALKAALARFVDAHAPVGPVGPDDTRTGAERMHVVGLLREKLTALVSKCLDEHQCACGECGSGSGSETDADDDPLAISQD